MFLLIRRAIGKSIPNDKGKIKNPRAKAVRSLQFATRSTFNALGIVAGSTTYLWSLQSELEIHLDPSSIGDDDFEPSELIKRIMADWKSYRSISDPKTRQAVLDSFYNALKNVFVGGSIVCIVAAVVISFTFLVMGKRNKDLVMVMKDPWPHRGVDKRRTKYTDGYPLSPVQRQKAVVSPNNATASFTQNLSASQVRSLRSPPRSAMQTRTGMILS